MMMDMMMEKPTVLTLMGGKVINMKYTLESLPYGSVIQYRNKRYYKCEGLEGDILMTEKNGGVWYCISNTSWKKFKVLFTP